MFKLPPILVTGTHRSGSTWCGNLLSLSPSVHNLHEPFNPISPPGMAYPHIPSMYAFGDGGEWPEFVSAMSKLCSGYFPPFSRKGTGFSDRLSLIKKSYSLGLSTFMGKRLLIKSPESMLISRTFIEKNKGQVVCLVRHPCSFVLSCERMNWGFDLNFLKNQHEFRKVVLSRLPKFGSCEDPKIPRKIVENTWVWCALNEYARMLSEINGINKRLLIVTHEELCRDPLIEFSKIFDFCGIPFDVKINKEIIKQTSGQIVTIKNGKQHEFVRDSYRLIDAWKDEIKPEISDWIVSTAGPQMERFYPKRSET